MSQIAKPKRALYAPTNVSTAVTTSQIHGSQRLIMTYMGFHKWGYPIAGWFVVENPIKMDDWGYPYLRKPPYLCSQPWTSRSWDSNEIRSTSSIERAFARAVFLGVQRSADQPVQSINNYHIIPYSSIFMNPEPLRQMLFFSWS